LCLGCKGGGHQNSLKLFFSKNEQKEKYYLFFIFSTKRLRVVILSMGEGIKNFLHFFFSKISTRKNNYPFLFLCEGGMAP
jgi:hypothetical protein